MHVNTFDSLNRIKVRLLLNENWSGLTCIF